KVSPKFIDPLQKAKDYAFLLLKYRPRSEKEIYQRLKRKKFKESIIQQTLIFLRNKEFVNDVYFSQLWVESRLKRPFGLRRIKEELRLKGIDKEIINDVLEKTKENYSEEEVVKQLVKERLRRLKKIEPQKAKQRLYSYLLRRGFSAEVITDVLNEL
ncbi:MAG: recombination regulator RecX, partial [Candidatus Omnitrophica bacterium]|nr:recombination regulator RecX [Candidatus Omnitrophota bacterium]